MDAEQVSEPFSEKLKRLFASVRNEQGNAYSKAEVAAGVGVSKAYIYELLGGKYEPGYGLLVRLAKFFEVPLDYFGDSERSRELGRQYELLAKLGEQGVNRLATRASELSPKKLRSVLEFMDFQAAKHEDE